MSRNRAMNWDKARRETLAQAERVSGPEKLYVRRAEKNDGWMTWYAKFEKACSVCGDGVIKGERCQLKRASTSGSARWLVRHEGCAP